jgi:hypothetical protein
MEKDDNYINNIKEKKISIKEDQKLQEELKNRKLNLQKEENLIDLVQIKNSTSNTFLIYL